VMGSGRVRGRGGYSVARPLVYATPPTAASGRAVWCRCVGRCMRACVGQQFSQSVRQSAVDAARLKLSDALHSSISSRAVAMHDRLYSACSIIM